MKMQIKVLLPIAMGGICILARAQESKPTQSVPAAKTIQASSPVNTNDYRPSTDRAEAAACTRNLEKINTAIEGYRKDSHDVPNWLSELVPKYLADTNVLICPVTT